MLLDKLGGKSFPYILIILSAVFAIIAFAQFPVENADSLQAETVWESLALGGFSLIFFASGIIFLFKDDSLKKRVKEKEKENIFLEKKLVTKSEECFKLNQAIDRAKKFIKENKNEINKPFLDKVVDILEGVYKDFSDFSAGAGDRIDAAHWINQRIRKWISEVNSECCVDYDVPCENLDAFRDDLEKHLELLCENILESKNSAPLLANPPVPQSVGSYKPYEKALRDIEKKVSRELVNEDSLTADSVQILQKSLSNFIELVKYSS